MVRLVALVVAFAPAGFMSGAESANSMQTSALRATLVIRDATAIDIGRRRVWSISPDGVNALVQGDGNRFCVVALSSDSAETCTDRIVNLDTEHIAWSPDGTTVALTESFARDLADSDLWVIHSDTGEVANLTDDGFHGLLPPLTGEIVVPIDFGPIFTSDGRALVFGRVTWGGGSWQAGLYRVDFGGGEPVRISDVGLLGDPYQISRYGTTWLDGATLLFSGFTAGSLGLFTIDLDTGVIEHVWDVPENVTPLQPLSDDRVFAHFTAGELGIFADDCRFGLLNLATGDRQYIRDGNGYCASTVGISPDGAYALVSSDPMYGYWLVDLTTQTSTEVDLTAAIKAIDERDRNSIAGAGSQPLVWTPDRLLFVANHFVPVLVRQEVIR
jgi:Tol biopolymer transport system component